MKFSLLHHGWLLMLLNSPGVCAFTGGSLGHRRLPFALSVAAQNRESNRNNSEKRPYRKSSSKTRRSGTKPKPQRDNSNSYFEEDNDWDTNYGTTTSPMVVVDWKVNEERLSAPIGCVHFGSCPGCIVDSDIGSVDVIESARLYFSSAPIRKHFLQNDEYDQDFYQVVVPSRITEWRSQAKLAVSAKSSWNRDGCIFGLYERGSHTVLEIPECAVHHPSINRAIVALKGATTKVGTMAYSEATGDGWLRYVQLQVDRLSGEVCLTLIWNCGPQIKEAQPALSRLVKQLRKLEPKLWHSIWCHTNDHPGNAIIARNGQWHQVEGPEFIREPIVGLRGEEENPQKLGFLYFTPTAFRQGNMDGFESIAQHVARAIPGNAKVCELYAGVGVLGLTALAHKSLEGTPLTWLRCSDENPNNPRCFERAVSSMPSDMTGRAPRHGKDQYKKFKRNSNNSYNNKNSNMIAVDMPEEEMSIADLMASLEREAAAGGQGQPKKQKQKDQLEEKDKVKYMVASAAKALYDGQALGANVLIVDPPRRGLEEEVLTQLCKPHNSNQDYTEDPMLLENRPKHQINWANDVQTLIYVSCGFDALARDCDRLLSTAGSGWKLESATGYILFPGSNHVETVAIFQRQL